ncbi:TPA: DUF645 family protein, partial [Vibrio cholerae]|nr:DUF645 family protein [Vibrio cholerae]HCZ9570417.1 DUF645 family protein [Vibrio cholerae]HCZ9595522.1 DUF645 family protein [Vibrio cholerae]HCZ9623950.1 DUF645 family protein [Vibrio cholerae]HCZ9660162.1 DUF645 family protein [Vibrio cholerae]
STSQLLALYVCLFDAFA